MSRILSEEQKLKAIERAKKWNMSHPERVREIVKRYHELNKPKIKRWRVEYNRSRKDIIVQAMRDLRKRKPWINSFHNAKARCTNTSAHFYPRYGGRGIKFMLTHDEVECLWKRDNAASMRRPSLDRIDNDGHYEFSNCHFMSASDHARKSAADRWKQKHAKQVLQIGEIEKTY